MIRVELLCSLEWRPFQPSVKTKGNFLCLISETYLIYELQHYRSTWREIRKNVNTEKIIKR